MPRPSIHPNLQAGGDTGDTLYKVGSARRPTAEPDNHTGEVGDLFYSMRDTKLRISDGYTVGGWYIIPDFEAVDTDILPSVNNFFNIGAPDNFFQNIYGGNVVVNGDLTVNGDTITNNNIENHTIILNVGGNDPSDSDQGGIKIFISENNFASILYDFSSDTFVINKKIQTDLIGDIYSENNVQILENGADGTDAWFKGFVYGQVSDISNHRLNDLLDVEAYPTDGQVLVWNNTTQLWEAGTVSGGGGSGSVNEAFKTITVNGQNDIVADSATDTLTLVAGNNITITTDSATDEITITSTASGTSTEFINDLLDVDTTNITDGQILAYDAANQEYKPVDPFTSSSFNTSFGAKSIDDLSDVDILDDYTITDGQTLVWDNANSEFIPGDRVTQDIFNTFFINQSIKDLTDVNADTITDGQMIVWDNANNEFVPATPFTSTSFDNSFGAKTISDLSDVDTTGITDGQVIKWDNAAGEFVPGDTVDQTIFNTFFANESIGDLSDVDTSTLADGQVLQYDSSQGKFLPVDLTTSSTDVINIINTTSIDELDDVDTSTSSPSDGQILIWNGTNQSWEPGNLNASGGGSTTLGGLTDTDTSGLQDGDALIYDSSTGDWKPVNIPTNGINYTYDSNSGKYKGDTFLFEGNEIPIRSIDYDNDEIVINPAAFTPTVSTTGQSLFWDQAATQFSVSVDNPTDFVSNYIASVDSITNATGVHTTLSDYTTTGPSVTPAGGIDWNQTFTTNATAKIVANGTGTTGGTANAEISFADDTSTVHSDTDIVYFNWGNVSASIIATIPNGQTFLGSYSTVNYTVNITGLSNSNNAVTTLTPTNGTISNTSGSGVFTPSSALIAGTVNGGSIDLSTEFTRPADVTGTSYTVTVTDTVTIPAGNFSYPSFYLFTSSQYVIPVVGDIVDGTGFKTGVTELGDAAYQIDTYITNPASVPQAMWIGIRSSGTQPTTFKTGFDPSLLADVAVVTGNTVDLEPTNPPTGYVAEEYTLYGITLQPGQTYVRIN